MRLPSDDSQAEVSPAWTSACDAHRCAKKGDTLAPHPPHSSTGCSAFRAARALGSTHVVSEVDEIIYPRPPRWGRFGIAALAVTGAVGLAGIAGGGASGATIAVPAMLLFGSTAAWPSFLPPRQEVYKGILAAGTGLGAAALAIGLWG